MTFKPADLPLEPMGTFIDTLGSAETEMCAALIVRWHQAVGHADWVPVSRAELGEFLLTDPVIAAWAKNPFWHPVPFRFAAEGFIDGWSTDPNTKGTLTPKFFEKLQKRARC